MNLRWTLRSLFLLLTVLAVCFAIFAWMAETDRVSRWNTVWTLKHSGVQLADEFSTWIQEKGVVPTVLDFSKRRQRPTRVVPGSPDVIKTFEGTYENGKPYYVQVIAHQYLESNVEYTQFCVDYWHEYRAKAWEADPAERDKLMTEINRWLKKKIDNP